MTVPSIEKKIAQFTARSIVHNHLYHAGQEEVFPVFGLLISFIIAKRRFNCCGLPG